MGVPGKAKGGWSSGGWGKGYGNGYGDPWGYGGGGGGGDTWTKGKGKGGATFTKGRGGDADYDENDAAAGKGGEERTWRIKTPYQVSKKILRASANLNGSCFSKEQRKMRLIS